MNQKLTKYAVGLIASSALLNCGKAADNLAATVADSPAAVFASVEAAVKDPAFVAKFTSLKAGKSSDLDLLVEKASGSLSAAAKLKATAPLQDFNRQFPTLATFLKANPAAAGKISLAEVRESAKLGQLLQGNGDTSSYKMTPARAVYVSTLIAAVYVYQRGHVAGAGLNLSGLDEAANAADQGLWRTQQTDGSVVQNYTAGRVFFHKNGMVTADCGPNNSAVTFAPNNEVNCFLRQDSSHVTLFNASTAKNPKTGVTTQRGSVQSFTRSPENSNGITRMKDSSFTPIPGSKVNLEPEYRIDPSNTGPVTTN